MGVYCRGVRAARCGRPADHRPVLVGAGAAIGVALETTTPAPQIEGQRLCTGRGRARPGEQLGPDRMAAGAVRCCSARRKSLRSTKPSPGRSPKTYVTHRDRAPTQRNSPIFRNGTTPPTEDAPSSGLVHPNRARAISVAMIDGGHMSARRRHIRYRVEVVILWFTLLLAVATVLVPDWAELLSGTDPDAGSGALEWSLVIALLVVSGVAAVAARRDRTLLRGLDGRHPSDGPPTT